MGVVQNHVWEKENEKVSFENSRVKVLFVTQNLLVRF